MVLLRVMLMQKGGSAQRLQVADVASSKVDSPASCLSKGSPRQHGYGAINLAAAPLPPFPCRSCSLLRMSGMERLNEVPCERPQSTNLEKVACVEGRSLEAGSMQLHSAKSLTLAGRGSRATMVELPAPSLKSRLRSLN